MRRRGMTFLEVLLTIVLLGMVLVAGSTLLYALTRTCFAVETGPLFARHADGVTTLLEYLAAHNRNNPDAAIKQFDWEKMPGGETPTLAFRIDDELAFIVSEERPLPPIRAYLLFEKDNGQFWLAWHPDKKGNKKPELQYSLLSPWARDIEYGYYDESTKEWSFERASETGRKNESTKPNRVRLIFERAGDEQLRALTIGEAHADVLLY